MVDKQITGRKGGLEDRGDSPCVGLGLFVDPQDGRVGSPVPDGGLNPGNGGFINEIVPPP